MARSVLLLCALSLPVAAQASLPGFELERLSPNPGSRESLVLDTGDVLEERALRLSLAGHYEHDPLVLVVNGQRVGSYISSRFTTHLAAAFGLTRFAEVGLQVPIVTFQSGDDLSVRGYRPPPGFALGAPTLQGRFGVLRQGDGQPVDLGLSLGLSLPLGSSEALTKDPAPGLGLVPRVGLGRAVGIVRLGAELGAVVRGGAVLSPTSARVSDEVGSLFTAGASVVTTNQGPRGELMMRAAIPFTRSPPSLEVLGGVRYAFLRGEQRDQLEAYVIGGAGIGHAPGTPAFRLLAGLAWTPVFGARDDNEPPALTSR